jgi:glycosyltransferase involved in cell wall biosynthesis
VAPPWYEVPPRAYGGIEWVAHWLSEALARRGHAVTLIAAGRRRTRCSYVQTSRKAEGPLLGWSDKPERRHATEAERICAALDLDLVHDHSGFLSNAVTSRKIPIVVSAHWSKQDDPLRYQPRRGTFFVAVSQTQALLTPGVAWRAVIPHGIPVDEFPFRKRKGGYLLFLGRMTPEKGAHLAIEAALQTGNRLLIAAKCSAPDERRYFRDHIAPRLGPEIKWLGEVNTRKKKKLLSRADCLLFPVQHVEPFGLVMAEAQACGTPVVALRAGSVSDLVNDGITGVVCDHPVELPDAINRAVRLNPNDCRAWIAQRFSIELMTSRYEALYSALISR